MTSSETPRPPSSILIVGAGVFGLSTAYALAQRPLYSKTKIVLVDPHTSIPSYTTATTASIDNTRIIRADYSDPCYAELAAQAQEYWRQTGDDQLGGQGRYSECGLHLTSERGKEGYVRKALENVRRLQGVDERGIPELIGAEQIAEAMRAPGAAIGSGEVGYVNTQSGWADAERSMRWLWEKVKATNRVDFITGRASKVLTDGKTALGVQLENGEKVFAKLTILATGAWTGTLVDLRGVASPRAQCIGYLSLTQDETKALKDIPVHLNLATGLFYFPPSADGELKVARHAFGYSNPTTIPAPLGSGTGVETITTTIPAFPPAIPSIDEQVLIDFVNSSLLTLKNRPKPVEKLRHSRLCWYLDTASSDFLVCPYPGYGSSLYLATGGSGHGFKFLPVLGSRIVDVIDGTDTRMNKSVWTKKWAWPGRGTPQHTPSGLTDAYVDEAGEMWCLDGSRGGEMGLKLAEALAGKQQSSHALSKITKRKSGSETSGKSRL